MTGLEGSFRVRDLFSGIIKDHFGRSLYIQGCVDAKPGCILRQRRKEAKDRLKGRKTSWLRKFPANFQHRMQMRGILHYNAFASQCLCITTPW
jgi:hypothetical protein